MPRTAGPKISNAEDVSPRDVTVTIAIAEMDINKLGEFIAKAVKAAKADPYKGVTVAGNLKVYAEGA